MERQSGDGGGEGTHKIILINVEYFYAVFHHFKNGLTLVGNYCNFFFVSSSLILELGA